MTNMPPNDDFLHFGWVVIAICVPTYLLTIFLIHHKGWHFWIDKRKTVYHWLGHLTGGRLGHVDPGLGSPNNFHDPVAGPPRRRATRNISKSEHNAKLARSVSVTIPPSSPLPTRKIEKPMLKLVDPFNHVQTLTAVGQEEEAPIRTPESAPP